MKFVRRASLVFSLVLIVAIVVGYVARSSELAGDRDLRLSSSAELGAAHRVVAARPCWPLSRSFGRSMVT